MPSAIDVIRNELDGVHLRLLLAQLLMLPFPPHAGGRIRVAVLRLAGFQIGRGTLIWGMPTITGSGNLFNHLTIGDGCWINQKCFFDISAPIVVHNNVAIGQDSMILTGTHQIGPARRRAIGFEAHPVTIGEGVWIAARVTVLPGVTIGVGAVIACGAVVTKNIPPNVLADGVPCRVIRELEMDEA